MGIFKRLFKVGEAAANKAVDELENPELMLDQAIRDKETQIKEAKRSVMEFIATSRGTKAELEKEKDERKTWNTRAEKAVAEEREDLAVKALQRVDEAEAKIKTLDAAWKQQQSSVNGLKAEITAMENELAEFRRNKDFIIAQSKTADLKKQVYQAKAKMGKDTSADDLMARLKAKADRAVHEADAAEEMADSFGSGDSLEKEFNTLDTNAQSDAMEDRLAKLRAKVNKD